MYQTQICDDYNEDSNKRYMIFNDLKSDVQLQWGGPTSSSPSDFKKKSDFQLHSSSPSDYKKKYDFQQQWGRPTAFCHLSCTGTSQSPPPSPTSQNLILLCLFCSFFSVVFFSDPSFVGMLLLLVRLLRLFVFDAHPKETQGIPGDLVERRKLSSHSLPDKVGALW